MKYVIKLGGAGLENPILLQGCVHAISDLVKDGNQVRVVYSRGGWLDVNTLNDVVKGSSFR